MPQLPTGVTVAALSVLSSYSLTIGGAAAIGGFATTDPQGAMTLALGLESDAIDALPARGYDDICRLRIGGWFGSKATPSTQELRVHRLCRRRIKRHAEVVA
jgi:hypothetical protein